MNMSVRRLIDVIGSATATGVPPHSLTFAQCETIARAVAGAAERDAQPVGDGKPFSADAAFRVLGAIDDQMAIALFVEAWREGDWNECQLCACATPEGRDAWLAEVMMHPAPSPVRA